MRAVPLALFLLFPLPVLAAECPAPETPVVEVKLVQDRPIQDRKLGIRDLQSVMNLDKEKALGGGGQAHVPFGVTIVNAGYETSVETRVLSAPDGTNCASLSKLTFTFHFSDVEVHIAKELPQGSCIEREVIAHENKHLAVDAGLVRGWQNRIAEVVKSAARTMGTVRVTTAGKAPSIISQRLKPTLDAATNTLLKERARQQAQVDSPAEYSRVSGSCGGEAQKIIRQVMK